jgi:hypothetical protein
MLMSVVLPAPLGPSSAKISPRWMSRLMLRRPRSHRRRSCPARALKLKADETVVFAWIVYSSRKQRDAINKKVMADPRLQGLCDPKSMPFDAKRMFFGGFKTIVEY